MSALQNSNRRTSLLHMSQQWIHRCLLLSSSTLLIVSVITIGVKLSPNDIWNSKNSFSDLKIEYPEGSLYLPPVPPLIFGFLDPLLVGAAVSCLVISAACIAITFRSIKQGPIKAIFWARVFVRGVLLINFLLSLTTFLVLFILHGKSAHVNPDTQKTIVESPPCENCITKTLEISFPDPFDRETWSCQIGAYDRFLYPDDANVYRQYCSVSKAGRWMSPFLALFSAMIGFLFYVDWINQRRLIRTWKSREVGTIHLNSSELSINDW